LKPTTIDPVGTGTVAATPTKRSTTWALRFVYHPVLRKVGRSLGVAFGVMVVSFSILRLAPGDPAQTILGETATPASLAAMRQKLGLDGSVLHQFRNYAVPLLHGDFGTSVTTGQPVWSVIKNSMPVTLSLIALAMGLALTISLLLAVPAARYRFGVPGLIFRLLTSVSLSIPVFFSGQVLILLLAVKWNLLPVGGYTPGFPGNLKYLLLPAVTACGPLVPILVRVLQSSVVYTTGQGFVETAQVRGISGPKLTWRYLLRPSLAPTIALSSYIVGSLFGAAMVLETVYNLPGIGQRLLTAVLGRDYPVVQGIVFIIGILVVVINLLGDLISGGLDPRAKVTR
jgi:peptide/nickel transport system permease protein